MARAAWGSAELARHLMPPQLLRGLKRDPGLRKLIEEKEAEMDAEKRP